MTVDARSIARALGGDVLKDHKGQLYVSAPGPGHSPTDRSMSVLVGPEFPDGFWVTAHSPKDNALACKDLVLARLGIQRACPGPDRAKVVRLRPRPPEPGDDARRRRTLALWNEAVDPRGTVVETYLKSRSLDLAEDVAGTVLRFHPACPWRENDERLIYVPAMVAAMRNIATDEITATHRTRLSTEGTKLGRRMLGIAAGAAIKLDADEAVTHGLSIGEGIETALAARQDFGFRPAWATGSVGGIASFPLLSGIEAITILAEREPDGSPNVASARAVQKCGERWYGSGREVIVIEPPAGDVNDALKARRAAA